MTVEWVDWFNHRRVLAPIGYPAVVDRVDLGGRVFVIPATSNPATLNVWLPDRQAATSRNRCAGARLRRRTTGGNDRSRRK